MAEQVNEWPDQTDIALHMPYLEELASQAESVLELGCGHGNGSTRALVRGLERSRREYKLMISVDMDTNRPECKPTQPWWWKINADSRDENAVLLALVLVDQFDLIYIDTDHTYDQMKAELKVWSRMSHADTVWVFHDTWMFGVYNPMTDAIKEFAIEHGLVFIDHSRESHGLGVMRNALS